MSHTLFRFSRGQLTLSVVATVCLLSGLRPEPARAQGTPLPAGRWYLHETRVARAARNDTYRTMDVAYTRGSLVVNDTTMIAGRVVTAATRMFRLDGSSVLDTVAGSPPLIVERQLLRSERTIQLQERILSGAAPGATMTEDIAVRDDALLITRRTGPPFPSEVEHLLRRAPVVRPVAPRTLGAAMAESWRINGAYFEELIAAMPEDRFAFKATDGQQTFAEVVIHTAATLKLQAGALSGQRPSVITDTTGVRKGDYVALAAEAFAYAAAQVAEVGDDQWHQVIPWVSRLLDGTVLSKLRVVGVMRDHMAHERGLLIAYLRLNGISPPPYVGV